MSFFESIGKVIEFSGISELFQLVYSSVTAVHTVYSLYKYCETICSS